MTLAYGGDNKMAKKFYNSLTDEKKIEDAVVEEATVVEEKPKKKPTIIGYVANCDKVNIRKQPNKEGDNVVKVLAAGAAVEIKDGYGDFYELVDGTYVMKAYVNC